MYNAEGIWGWWCHLTNLRIIRGQSLTSLSVGQLTDCLKTVDLPTTTTMPSRQVYLILVFACGLAILTYIYIVSGPSPGNDSKAQGLARHLATMPDNIEPVHGLDRGEGLEITPPIKLPMLLQISPRLAQYCNHPAQGVKGQEGDVPGRYKLLSVHVIIRHGDRSSMYGLNKHPNPIIPCTMDPVSLSHHPKLRSFIPTMHAYSGKQHPNSGFKNWALFPAREQCRSAELTGLGALQHVLLGDFLNKKYIHKWQLFGGNFTPDKILIMATEFSRTYQSAISFLYGFLPQFNLTELDIQQKKNVYFCDTVYAKGSCQCPAIFSLRRIVSKIASLRKNKLEYKALTGEIADVYGLKRSQLPWDSALMDIFMAQVCHNVKLTCNLMGKCITQDTLEKLWLHVDGLEKSNNEALLTTERMSRIAVHPLLVEIATRMRNITLGIDVPRFVLYSGHDTTVSPLAHALGIHDGKWPPYATRIVFEQYVRYDIDSGARYYLRVLYNGKDVTRNVRFCDSSQKDGLCQLKHFWHFVREKNLNDLNSETYEDACH